MPSRTFLSGGILFSLLLASPCLAAIWSAHELIGTNNAYEDWSPEIAVLPDGRPIVVWMGADPAGDAEAFYCLRDPESGWGQG